MMVKINDDNKTVVWISGISIFVSLLLYVVYPPLRGAVGIYGVMSIICLVFYTNPAFQPYLIGIPKKKLFNSILFGVGIGLAFWILPKVIPGMSMGIPILPASVEENLKWVIICLFAPFIEEIATRGALLGFVKYLGRKKKVTKKILWIAIISQAIFFMVLHATAYSAGWYTAPTWLGAFSNLSAVSASLIAAGLFGLIMGFVVTRKGVKSLAVSIVAHYVVNQILFVKFNVVVSIVLSLVGG